MTLSKLRGETVVLYFYPRADTPGCTTQACGVRDRGGDYAEAGARVIGVSPDEVEGDRRSSPASTTSTSPCSPTPTTRSPRPTATWVEKSMYGKKYMGVQRATFIIDPDGKIARVFPKVQPKKHDDLVLKALGELSAALRGPRAIGRRRPRLEARTSRSPPAG